MQQAAKMAKRRFTMTTVEVLERWDNFGKDLEMGSSDKMSDDNQLKFPEEFDELDDPDESIMEGSDDKFSDLGEVEEDEHDGTYFVHPRTSSPGSSEVYTSFSFIYSITFHYTYISFYIPSCYNPSKH